MKKDEILFNTLDYIGRITEYDLDQLQFAYANHLLWKKATDKQREVIFLKSRLATEELIASVLSISRRAVRERMELVQKKGEKAVTEAQRYTDRAELRLKIINSNKELSVIYNTIKELYEADELLKKRKGE